MGLDATLARYDEQSNEMIVILYMRKHHAIHDYIMGQADAWSDASSHPSKLKVSRKKIMFILTEMTETLEVIQHDVLEEHIKDYIEHDLTLSIIKLKEVLKYPDEMFYYSYS